MTGYMTGEETAAREGWSPRDTLSMSLLVAYVCLMLSLTETKDRRQAHKGVNDQLAPPH
jgi:hypothetical protein